MSSARLRGANQLQADIRAEPEHVPELDIEIAQGLEQSRIQQRACADRIEPDSFRDFHGAACQRERIAWARGCVLCSDGPRERI